jgi:hypothetical protein
MEPTILTQLPASQAPSYQEAWDMVLSQLRMEMSRAQFETWVQPLRPLGYKERIFTLSAFNPFARDWVENRLKSRIVHLMEGLYNETVTLQVVVGNAFYREGDRQSAPAAQAPAATGELAAESPDGLAGPAASAASAATTEPPPLTKNRKVMLQRAYGSERARVIQPERGMFVTLYFFDNWLPLIGHSAVAIILAARSMCYWNPMTGELRNEVETEMGELARRAAVSVRTVKDVLNTELVQRYFLRYKVRRIVTPNGVRTAGILLQVRMDDPLTPEDQAAYSQPEEERWYSVDFEEGEEGS